MYCSRTVKIAVALGKLGSLVHGVLDARCPFDDEGSFATGTVSGFWGIVWGLAELGHHVDAYSDVKEAVPLNRELGGASVWNIDAWPGPVEYDAYISVLESDLLAKTPTTKPRILAQWLNDFTYCKIDPEAAADLFACPSETHRSHIVTKMGVPKTKTAVVPLMMHPEFYDLSAPRRPLSIAYASSPDRGLHYLLDVFPDVRKEVPGTELRIYYRVVPWLEDMLKEKSQRGSRLWKRAMSIKTAYEKSVAEPDAGIRFVGPLTTKKMIAELCRTRVLAYPCDPVKFTEGFSVTMLDACSAGCVPITSGVDAFPELWSKGAVVIPGHPSPANRTEWIREIVRALSDDNYAADMSLSASKHAKNFSRHQVAAQWEELILRGIQEKRSL